jgi:hypothetical protein
LSILLPSSNTTIDGSAVTPGTVIAWSRRSINTFCTTSPRGVPTRTAICPRNTAGTVKRSPVESASSVSSWVCLT